MAVEPVPVERWSWVVALLRARFGLRLWHGLLVVLLLESVIAHLRGHDSNADVGPQAGKEH